MRGMVCEEPPKLGFEHIEHCAEKDGFEVDGCVLEPIEHVHEVGDEPRACDHAVREVDVDVSELLGDEVAVVGE